jgi:hypothetical protein
MVPIDVVVELRLAPGSQIKGLRRAKNLASKILGAEALPRGLQRKLAGLARLGNSASNPLCRPPGPFRTAHDGHPYMMARCHAGAQPTTGIVQRPLGGLGQRPVWPPRGPLDGLHKRSCL